MVDGSKLRHVPHAHSRYGHERLKHQVSVALGATTSGGLSHFCAQHC